MPPNAVKMRKWEVEGQALKMRAARVLCNPASYGNNEAAESLGENIAERAGII